MKERFCQQKDSLPFPDVKKVFQNIPEKNIINVPSDIYLEGGDIVVDNKLVYVGISERATMDGVSFLRKVLGNDYSVIPLKLKPKFLHLDVVLVIYGLDILFALAMLVYMLYDATVGIIIYSILFIILIICN